MPGKKFLIVSLLLSIVGLLILVMLAVMAEPEYYKISELDTKIGKIVALDVSVDYISYSDDAVFLTLSDETGTIKAVFFGDPTDDIIRDDKIAVKGKIASYKGELEIVIQELKCLNC
jgi:DNA/RNA endonuclease YhcR with UshA esterase domain